MDQDNVFLIEKYDSKDEHLIILLLCQLLGVPDMV